MWIFISPAVMDTVVFLVMFAVSYGAGERGLNQHQWAWLGGLFQLVYMGASLAAGAVLTRRNAKPLLLGSVVLCLLTSAAALILTGFVPLLIALAGFGVGCAVFFNAFQTFMRGEAPPGGLVRVIALYTVAWSSGASLGFLASGSLYRLGGVVMSLLVLGATAYIFVLLVRHRARPDDSPSADEHVEEAPGHRPGLHEAYVGVAWVMIFTAMFVQRPLQTYYPALAGRAGVAAALAGIPLFVHMLLQAVAGGLMVKARHWLYRPGILASVQLLAAALLIVVWRFPGYAVTGPGIGLLGLWAGFMYFCAVFYASNAGNRSRNIGVNECLVGLGSFAGLFVSEWFMTKLGDDAIMYAVCAAALLISIGVQLVLTHRVNERRNYNIFYVTSVIVAFIMLLPLLYAPPLKTSLPHLPFLATGFAVAYCILMPRINLQMTILVMLIGCCIVLLMGKYIAPLPEQEVSWKRTVVVVGYLFFSLAVPVTTGLIAHGIAVMCRKK